MPDKPETTHPTPAEFSAWLKEIEALKSEHRKGKRQKPSGLTLGEDEEDPTRGRLGPTDCHLEPRPWRFN